MSIKMLQFFCSCHSCAAEEIKARAIKSRGNEPRWKIALGGVKSSRRRFAPSISGPRSCHLYLKPASCCVPRSRSGALRGSFWSLRKGCAARRAPPPWRGVRGTGRGPAAAGCHKRGRKTGWRKAPQPRSDEARRPSACRGLLPLRGSARLCPQGRWCPASPAFLGLCQVGRQQRHVPSCLT